MDVSITLSGMAFNAVEAATTEQAARMGAMENASKIAGEMLD